MFPPCFRSKNFCETIYKDYLTTSTKPIKMYSLTWMSIKGDGGDLAFHRLLDGGHPLAKNPTRAEN